MVEQFYFVTGETMTRFRKSIEHWKDHNKSRSEASLGFDKLLGQYHMGIFDLCSQYDDIYRMLESDMQTVKAALLKSFEIS